jgi:hypothetical protein
VSAFFIASFAAAVSASLKLSPLKYRNTIAAVSSVSKRAISSVRSAPVSAMLLHSL